MWCLQGVITSTDNQTYFEMALMDGYNDPTEAEVSRIMFFTPNGTMLPVDQVHCISFYL